MSKTRDTLFVVLVSFWTFLIIFSNIFVDYLEKPLVTGSIEDITVKNIPEKDTASILERIFNVLDNIPVVNVFTPLFKIMLFQYTDQIPYTVSILLSLITALSGFVLYGLIRWGT